MIARLYHVIKQLCCESYSARNNRERLTRNEKYDETQLEICIVYSLLAQSHVPTSYIIDGGKMESRKSFIIANNRVRGESLNSMLHYVIIFRKFPLRVLGVFIGARRISISLVLLDLETI